PVAGAPAGLAAAGVAGLTIGLGTRRTGAVGNGGVGVVGRCSSMRSLSVGGTTRPTVGFGGGAGAGGGAAATGSATAGGGSITGGGGAVGGSIAGGGGTSTAATGGGGTSAAGASTIGAGS